MASFRTLRTQYASLLSRFLTSSKDFEVLNTVCSGHAATAKVLYVLDSSFNPPTLAHLRIASTALLERLDSSSRLVLLLATQNADKPSKPASFEDRLAMMELFAHDLRSHLATKSGATNTQAQEWIPAIDIGVTKKPYFVDKASSISGSGIYPTQVEQIHLTGYDTLIRIMNTKYYPPDHTLRSLTPLFAQHRLRVTMRTGDEWGSKAEQEEFLLSLARGDREGEGGKKEWADRIQLVEGKAPGDPPISSTKAREAAKSAAHDLDWLVPENVRQFMLSERPYAADSVKPLI